MKKQTQFAKGRMDVNAFVRMAYEEIARFPGRKTKPIQSQFGCLAAENAECAESIDV
jgi:hypothetical protein